MSELLNIQFLNGYVLIPSKSKEVQESIFKVLKNGLPEEAHTLEITKYILDQCINSLPSIGLKL